MWQAEIARRMREYRENKAVLVPGEQGDADALAAIAFARSMRSGPSSS